MKHSTALIFAASLVIPLSALADESEKVRKLFLEGISADVEAVGDTAFKGVFRFPVYRIKVTLIPESVKAKFPIDQTIYQSESGLVHIFTPTTDEELPYLKELIGPEFRLTEETAPRLEAALRGLMSSRFFDDKESRTVSADGEWRFITGKFFKDNKGFVIRVDDEGSVTGASYVLRIKE